MFEIILTIIFLIPAMLGLAEILHISKLQILKPSKQMIAYKIVILTEETAIENMRYAIEQYLWQSGGNNGSLIFINSLLSNDTFDQCKTMAGKYGLGFYSKQEIKDYLDLIV